jgi:hypothetical protein
MEHVVFYPAATGVPAFRRVSSLDEAVNFVEHLRNVENITDFSVHELAPVQLSFRAYYHAHVPAAAGDESAPVAEVAAPDEAPAPVEDAVAAEPVAEASDAPVEVSDVAVEDAVENAVEESAPVLVVVAEPEGGTDAPEEPVAVSDEVDEVDEVSEAVSLAPVEASDDDRSAEWVAEAEVVEAPVVVPAVAQAEVAEPEVAAEEVAEVAEAADEEAPVVPGLAAAEPVVAVVPPFADPVVGADEPEADQVAEVEQVVEPEPVVAPAPRGPFADAPPVLAPSTEAKIEDAPAEEIDPVLEAGTPDVVPALAPSGRRSLGFFAR